MIQSEQQGNNSTRLPVSWSVGYARINTIGDSLRLITEKSLIHSEAIHQWTHVDESTFSKALAHACLKSLALLG